MKTQLFFFVITLASFEVIAAPKRVTVANASDSTVKVCIYMGNTVDDIGQATGVFKSLKLGESFTYEYQFINGRFIHTVLFLQNNDKIVFNTFQASSSDAKEVTVNVTNLAAKPVDLPEMQRMRNLVTTELEDFSKTYIKYVRINAEASLGLQEYLGAIVVVDTTQQDSRNAIKLIYTARQLDISENPALGGRSFQESFRLTKDFAGSAQMSIPSAFSSNINFSNADMHEVMLSCKTIGTVLLPTRPGVTAIGSLLAFDDKSVENIVGTITEVLDNCKPCILQQVQAILAHGGVSVNVKRYRKSAVAFTGNAASVLTSKGTYIYENNNDSFDIISPKVIAIGFSAISLKTSFAQTVIEKLQLRKSEIDRQLNNQQLAVSNLTAQQQELTTLINRLSQFN